MMQHTPHDEPNNAFEAFIEQHLRLTDGDDFPMVPQAVIDAAWQRFLQRLEQQTQTLAADPQVDLWEEQLTEEHRAVVAAIQTAFTPLSREGLLNTVDRAEWQYLLHAIAVLTLHIEENRSQVLEPGDILPYLDHLSPNDSEGSDELLAETLPFGFSIKQDDVQTTPQRKQRFSGLDLLLVFTLSGIFWLLLCEFTALGGT